MSLTIAKQYIGAYADLHEKIQISGFGVKNKPKIRICQSGTYMQRLVKPFDARKVLVLVLVVTKKVSFTSLACRIFTAKSNETVLDCHRLSDLMV